MLRWMHGAEAGMGVAALLLIVVAKTMPGPTEVAVYAILQSIVMHQGH